MNFGLLFSILYASNHIWYFGSICSLGKKFEFLISYDPYFYFLVIQRNPLSLVNKSLFFGRRPLVIIPSGGYFDNQDLENDKQ